MKGARVNVQLQPTASVTNTIPRREGLAQAIMMISGDGSVNTDVYPRRDSILRPVRRDQSITL
jgi:hypothetical protein